jgi:ATP-dependent Clp protease adaptor protein ClpS
MPRSVHEYLQHILDEAEHLADRLEGINKGTFLQDETLKRAFVRSIEIIGGATKQIPDSLRRQSSAHSPVNEPKVVRESDAHPETTLEPLFLILIHNDDVTPYDYVILVLRIVFQLSAEMAEHITWIAHNEGIAPVVTRPRSEAVRLVNAAHAAARQDGFPLRFSLEQED